MSNELFGNNGANFSQDRNYRYALWRIWDKSLPLVMFIGLNPSTANEDKNDATIRRVISFARAWGYGGVYMMNCFAYVSTDPKLLKSNPMSEEWNNDMLTITASKCKEVIFAWGNFSIVKETGRDEELIGMFPNAKVLIINKDGSPRHPLYVPLKTIPVIFKNSKP